MKDIQNQLSHLEIEIADCELISKMAVDPAKRDLFARLAEQYTKMRNELQMAVQPNDTAA